MKLVSALNLGLVALLVGPLLYAQEKPTPTLLNGWLREQSTTFDSWDIGGQLRVRLESKEHFATPGTPAVDFQKIGGNADNTYWLFREKFHVGYKAADWLTIYGEARDSRSVNDDRSPDPESDPLDLQQGYVLLGNAKSFPITAKVGRQELSYGDERLVGPLDWSNVGRVFDAAKLRYENSQFWIDGFVSRVDLSASHAHFLKM